MLSLDRSKTFTLEINLKHLVQETPSKLLPKTMGQTKILILIMGSHQWEMETKSKLDFKILILTSQM